MQELLSLVIKVSDNTIEYSICKGTKIIQIKSNRRKKSSQKLQRPPFPLKNTHHQQTTIQYITEQYQQFDTIKNYTRKSKRCFIQKYSLSLQRLLSEY